MFNSISSAIVISTGWYSTLIQCVKPHLKLVLVLFIGPFMHKDWFLWGRQSGCKSLQKGSKELICKMILNEVWHAGKNRNSFLHLVLPLLFNGDINDITKVKFVSYWKKPVWCNLGQGGSFIKLKIEKIVNLISFFIENNKQGTLTS